MNATITTTVRATDAPWHLDTLVIDDGVESVSTPAAAVHPCSSVGDTSGGSFAWLQDDSGKQRAYK